MKHLRLIAACLMFGLLAACGAAQDIVYKDPDIAKYKTGNRVILASGSLVSDVVMIEMLKHGKFALAGTSSDAAPAAKDEIAKPGAKGAPATVKPDPNSYDYIFRVNALVYNYMPQGNALGVRYSFSVTTKTGEIVYIKVIAGGDLKTSMAGTFTEVAALLL
jgi:hypothetical protein